MPLLMGGMKGPRSFIAAGEIADGMHHALSYSREAYDYVVENVRKGADNAGRSIDDLDIGAWVVTVVAEDSAAAKRAARILVAFYISSMPRSSSPATGSSPRRSSPSSTRSARGDVAGAIERFSPELAERLSVAGTPEECVEKIKTDIQPAGVDHMILALSDAHLVEFFSGEQVEGVPGINEQLKLVADRMMPAFA